MDHSIKMNTLERKKQEIKGKKEKKEKSDAANFVKICWFLFLNFQEKKNLFLNPKCFL